MPAEAPRYADIRIEHVGSGETHCVVFSPDHGIELLDVRLSEPSHPRSVQLQHVLIGCMIQLAFATTPRIVPTSVTVTAVIKSIRFSSTSCTVTFVYRDVDG
jgi:hypothetical protein